MNDFFLFSLPNSNIFNLIKNDDDSEKYQINCFSFDNKKEINFKSNELKIIDLDNFNLNINFEKIQVKTDFNQISENEYQIKIQNCINEIQKGKLKKIVFSRKKNIPNKGINFNETLKNLRLKFPNTFIYLFQKNEEIWLGATPELLASLENSTLKTIALAGTLSKNKSFSDKEIKEQEMVKFFILDILEKYSSNILISETKEYYFNQIKHLITEFSAEINPIYFEKITNKLHPTPAISGLPQKESFEFILNNENYNREFYTGKINLNLNQQKKSYVNLRCFKIFADFLVFFVGGGITKESNPKKEWLETEIKINSISEQIVFY